MKKEIMKRALLGFPLGITWEYFITIFISLALGKGYYTRCVPSLIEAMGTEIGAVMLQSTLCGLVGMIFGAASVIWEMESWSIVKQTGLYFLIAAIAIIPTAYALHWMEQSIKGALGYIGIFILIFVCIWISQYIVWKIKIKKINEKLEQ
jgi:hypothetical protein